MESQGDMSTTRRDKKTAWRRRRERKESGGEGNAKIGKKMEEGEECERSTMSIPLFSGLPSPFLHSASD